jgi:PiT family inorganic phosphate transporter
VVGVIALLVLLAAACTVIWRISRRNQITKDNVTDAADVVVLATVPASETYPNDPRLAAAAAKHKSKNKRKKYKSAA